LCRRAIAKKYNVVPVKLVKDELFVAMSDPLNFVAQEEIKAASHKRVVPMISTRRATEQAIGTLYGSEGTARAIEENEARGRHIHTGYRAGADEPNGCRQRVCRADDPLCKLRH